METELKSLKIDRKKRRAGADGGSSWAAKWIVSGIVLFALLGLGNFVYGRLNSAIEVETVRARAVAPATSAAQGEVVLNATGYIMAAHKIELASKVVGRVAWIGVEKGDRVKQGQVLVRLEDDEYKAQVQQAKGGLEQLEARLAEAVNGSRPEEIARANADVEQAKADLADTKITLDRTKKLVDAKVSPQRDLDDAQAKHDSAAAKLNSLQRTADLARIGTRKEQVDAIRGQIVQAKGQFDFYQNQLSNTVISAPTAGTILERNVERGEFVTTGFVGDKGAKGYVVSMADLNDLKAELDINQNDFAKLSMGQKGVITTDAFPDVKYDGVIDEISPEANRQKATVQVKVKVLNPDSRLRPDMNSSVAFLASAKPLKNAAVADQKPVVYAPSSAIHEGAVFIVVDGHAIRKGVKTGPAGSQGVKIESGLIGGEDLINNPPPELKDGARVTVRKG
jgi:HlyD family secretion protein